MLITCDNKGCLQQTDALYDVESGEVICQACGKPIGNVSDAMKRTLKSFGQVVRKEKKVEALKSQQVASAERPKIQTGAKKKSAKKKTTRKKRGGND